MKGSSLPTKAAHPAACLSGGGQMGAVMRATDWSTTPLGSVESWSPALRMMVSVLLANRFPMLLWWGPQYVSIYNDAYRPILGTKHPKALGQPVSECWNEIWHILKPLIDTPFNGGSATWNDDILLEINRHGFVEETHFTIAYSPVPDESMTSGVGGVLATVHEITDKVVGERRILLLRDLGTRASEAKDADQACTIAAATLAQHPKDVPFALLYLFERDQQPRLAAATGIEPGHEQGDRKWPLAEVASQEQTQLVDDLDATLALVPPGPWTDAPHSAVVVPIRSTVARQPAGALVLGISSRLRFDHLYASFVELVAGQIATAIVNARAYEDERKRAEALADVNRAKTMFFSNVSHEFRTPLTLMIGPLEELLVRRGGDLPPADAHELEAVHRNGLRLLKLVNTLLDFSRIEAGGINVTYEPTALAPYTAGLASTFRSACERAGLRLIVDCPELPQPVYVDREMWERIVLNLVSNAFKSTLAGEIRVSMRASGDLAHLVVTDTGTGIPAESIPRLFERFYRVPNADGRTHEGTGIGLALVQELVRLHEGHISVESELGRGSTFTVTIPLGRDHLPVDRIGASRDTAWTATGAPPYVDEALRWLPDDEPSGRRKVSTPGRASASVSGAGGAAAQPRVLVADDNADMRDYVQRLLTGRFTVDAAADGEQAVTLARAHPPDLVLADVMMSRLDGFGVLRQLRADAATAAIPIILLSARAGEESRVEGLEAGADDYLVKPFSSRELLARVSGHLELARLRQTIFQRERGALATIKATEVQRRRLSRELHDEMGQELAALVLGLKSVGESVEDSAVRDCVQRLQALAMRLIREMHRIALELRPGALDDHGLKTALSNYVEEWTKRYGVGADFQSVGFGTERLPSHIETTIYRIVQEALTNVSKHAQATAVSVVLQRDPHEVVTIVEDDGRGFDAAGVDAATGLDGPIGLLGMKERAVLVGGTCQIESQPGGTSVFVRIPLQAGEGGSGA